MMYLFRYVTLHCLPHIHCLMYFFDCGMRFFFIVVYIFNYNYALFSVWFNSFSIRCDTHCCVICTFSWSDAQIHVIHVLVKECFFYYVVLPLHGGNFLLAHWMPVSHSYRNQSIDLLCIELLWKFFFMTEVSIW